MTPRQKEVLALIIRLFGLLEEPIGSKTLLAESEMKVSPATIRNDMSALEKEGMLVKAHRSSGRLPSKKGYRFYIQQLINHDPDIKIESPKASEIEEVDFDEIVNNQWYSPLQIARMSADMLVTLTGLTTIVLGQDLETHRFETFRLFVLDNHRVMALLMTDTGKMQSEIFDLPVQLTRQQAMDIAEMINEELAGLNLTDAYQRMKLSIPMIIQRMIGVQLDFSPLVQVMQDQVKGHQYFVSGKHEIYNLIEPSLGSQAIKDLLKLVDGSSDIYRLLEDQSEGVSVLFGYELNPDSLAHVNLLTSTYQSDQQKISIGLIGPMTMRYDTLIPLMYRLKDQLASNDE